jgi:hypothetical protein
MGTEQNVETINFHNNFFSPLKKLKYMTIDKPHGHQNLRTRRP